MSSEPAKAIPRKRSRVPRSCDRCRKNKARCVMHADTCDACAAARVRCLFSNPNSVYSRPPNANDAQLLRERIASLEHLLRIIQPDAAATTAPPLPTSSINTSSSSTKIESSASQSSPDGPDSPDQIDGQNDEPNLLYEAFVGLSLDSDKYVGDNAALSLAGPLRIDQGSAKKDPTSRVLQLYEPTDPVDHLLWQAANVQTWEETTKYWPEPTLESSLIALYFQHTHPLWPILHPHFFLKSHDAGLQHTDLGFRCLCLCVFAFASRFCADPRVLLDIDNINYLDDRQAAGYRFAYSVRHMLGPFGSAFSLYTLLASAILVRWLDGTGSTFVAWWQCGIALQAALDAGVHREKSPIWERDPLVNSLRKKAFITLIRHEFSLSGDMGRAPILTDSDFDTTMPPDELEAQLRLFDSPYMYSSRFNPESASQAWQAVLRHVKQRSLDCLKVASDALRRITVRRKASKQELIEDARLVVMLMERVCKIWHEGLAKELDWKPDEFDDVWLVTAAGMWTTFEFFRWLTYQHLFSLDSSNVSAIMEASKGARLVIDRLYLVYRRGLMAYTFEWVCARLLTAGIAIITYHRVHGTDPRSDPHICAAFDMFRVLAHGNFTAQKALVKLQAMLDANPGVEATPSGAPSGMKSVAPRGAPPKHQFGKPPPYLNPDWIASRLSDPSLTAADRVTLQAMSSSKPTPEAQISLNHLPDYSSRPPDHVTASSTSTNTTSTSSGYVPSFAQQHSKASLQQTQMPPRHQQEVQQQYECQPQRQYNDEYQYQRHDRPEHPYDSQNAQNHYQPLTGSGPLYEQQQGDGQAGHQIYQTSYKPQPTERAVPRYEQHLPTVDDGPSDQQIYQTSYKPQSTERALRRYEPQQRQPTVDGSSDQQIYQASYKAQLTEMAPRYEEQQRVEDQVDQDIYETSYKPQVEYHHLHAPPLLQPQYHHQPQPHDQYEFIAASHQSQMYEGQSEPWTVVGVPAYVNTGRPLS